MDYLDEDDGWGGFGFDYEKQICPKCGDDLPDGSQNDFGYCEICYGIYEMSQEDLDNQGDDLWNP